ncbi:hypothetical protein DPMN_030380 [Dreissena polymorpha]|uniref:Uncharacterized protein n=1 Tax=Dreissena polymorpha TaxID=45954 RepID=A0A9D4RGB3_DREPO|nr:hypothetical protein DPMN_030380 [Dreissena polymorpha]
MACEYPCVYCARNVGEEDKANSCDECERWQHLSCETGVSSTKGFTCLLLRREAETVDLTIRLVSVHALTRVHRKIFKEVHGRLFEIWRSTKTMT